MTQPRRAQINLESTPYYHCYNRSVRRAFLCGIDPYSGKSYEHRKQWIVDLIQLLGSAYAIDVSSYAIMSNHYHLTLHINQTKAESWSTEEVVERWLSIYPGDQLLKRFHKHEALSLAELEAVSVIAEKRREQLYSISHFMAKLDQTIARRANVEDEVTGRFWESRFKSKALLDEAAILTCMMYVDLNPIRAGISDSLEESDFTSIQQRLYEYVNSINQSKHVQDKTETKLAGIKTLKKRIHQHLKKSKSITADLVFPELQKFSDQTFDDTEDEPLIPCTTLGYFELIDWTGRVLRDDKKGAIPQTALPLLQKLNVDPNAMIETIQAYQKRFKTAVGSIEKLKAYAKAIKKKWLYGSKGACALYNSS